MHLIDKMCSIMHFTKQSSFKPLSEDLFHVIHTLLIYMVSTRENRYKGCRGLGKMTSIHIST